MLQCPHCGSSSLQLRLDEPGRIANGAAAAVGEVTTGELLISLWRVGGK
jgi:hypothetical protein